MVSRTIRRMFNLRYGEENKQVVLKNIKNNISFFGSNMWILACAIIIASVGLNVNSTAVVIGAMLISPLMGPIVAAGFALGTFDFGLLRRAGKNLITATLIGLVVSFIYFFISPFKEAQSELLSRTAPNIYDVLIAFSGGLVGVIAATRVEKGNPIPGVAIATALMPPLCTAGYGLATGNLNYFFGAMFLYTINCVFICLATYMVVKLLDYPSVVHVDAKAGRRVRNLIWLLVLALVLPGVYFAWEFYQQQAFSNKVATFIKKEFEDKGEVVVFKRTHYETTPKTIQLLVFGENYSKREQDSLNNLLFNYGLKNTHLHLLQDTSIAELRKLRQSGENEATNDRDARLVTELSTQLKKYEFNSDNLFAETKAFIPDLSSIAVSRQKVIFPNDSILFLPVVMFTSDSRISTEKFNDLQTWLKVRLKADTLELYRRE